MNTAAIYPGTFDPVTHGHLDLIARAARIFNRLVVAVAVSTQKATLFDAAERSDLVRRAAAVFPNVEVELFDGLLVHHARARGIHVLVRGLRAFSDFEYEFQMALTNRSLDPDIETLFLMPKEEFSYVSSSTVKEVARLGGNIEGFVPPAVAEALCARFGRGGPARARPGGTRA